MSHWDEGRLMAYLDEELPAEDVAVLEGHVAACSNCSSSLDALESGAARIRRELPAFDVPAPLLRVRATLAGRSRARAGSASRRPADGAREAPTRRRSGWWTRRSRLAQAATAAVPGSPVRTWLDRVRGVEAPADASVVPSPVGVAPSPEGGVRVGPDAGRIRVQLNDVPPGEEIRVTIVDGEEAAVFAPPGTRLYSGPGRLEANFTSGPLRIELPGQGRDVSLEADGRVVLRIVGGMIELTDTTALRDETEIRLRLQAP